MLDCIDVGSSLSEVSFFVVDGDKEEGGQGASVCSVREGRKGDSDEATQVTCGRIHSQERVSREVMGRYAFA